MRLGLKRIRKWRQIFGRGRIESEESEIRRRSNGVGICDVIVMTSRGKPPEATGILNVFIVPYKLYLTYVGLGKLYFIRYSYQNAAVKSGNSGRNPIIAQIGAKSTVREWMEASDKYRTVMTRTGAPVIALSSERTGEIHTQRGFPHSRIAGEISTFSVQFYDSFFAF